MAIERLTVEIDADAKDLKKGISDAKKELNSLTGKSVKLGVDKNSLSAFRNEAKKMLEGVKTSMSSIGFDKKAFKKLGDDMSSGFQAAVAGIQLPDQVGGIGDKLADEFKEASGGILHYKSALVEALKDSGALTEQQEKQLDDLFVKYQHLFSELDKGVTVDVDVSRVRQDFETLLDLQHEIELSYEGTQEALREGFDNGGLSIKDTYDYAHGISGLGAILDKINDIQNRIRPLSNLVGQEEGVNGVVHLNKELEKELSNVNGIRYSFQELQELLSDRTLEPFSDRFTALSNALAGHHKFVDKLAIEQSFERSAEAAERTRKAWATVKSISRGLGQAVLQPFQRAFNFVRRSIKRISTMFLRAFIFSAVMSEFNKIRDTLKNVIGTNEELKKSFATLRSAFMTAIIPIVRALEPVLIKIVNLVSLLLAKLAKLTSSIFGKTIAWSVSEAKAMKNVADETKRSVAGFDELTKLNLSDDEETIDTEPIEDLANSQTSGILAKIESIFEHLRPILEKVWQTIEKIWDASKPLIEAVLGAVDSLLSSGVFQKALDLITKIVGVVNPLVTTIVNVLSPVLESVLSFVLDVLDGITNSLKPIFEVLNNTLMPIIQRISDMVRPLLDKIGKTLGKILEPLGEVIAVLLDCLFTVLEPIFELLTPVFEVIGDIVECLGDDLKPIIQAIAMILKVTLVPVIKIIVGLIEFLQPVLKTLTTLIGGLVKKLIDGVGDILRGITSFFGKIANVFGGIINWVIRGINLLIQQINKIGFDFPDWMADFFGMENKHFGFNIKEIKEIQLPQFAKGGLVTQPTIAQIGEKGPEAVIPLNDTSWMERLAQTLNNNQSTVNLVIDGQKVGYAMINSINSITRQTGKQQLVMA